MEGLSVFNRTHGDGAWPAYTAGEGQPGRDGGGTIVTATTGPTNDDWENIFGPAGRDVKFDVQRFKREGRLHLPSVLEGVNHYLTDRIDGLITDATNSPFTTVILPYQYLHNPDAKFTWNRYSFDEGLASRVPYESAARTLAQTRRSYEGYTVRQGLAVTMEHNFMMSPAGRENFFNKWWQVVGSIQKTNDLDVHIALLSAPTYAIEVKNKYYSRTKTPHQIIREHVDMFGFLQKNVNALDILIEDAKITLRGWGGKEPSFMLCNSKLTMQLTMLPEKTNFITQGYDGIKRLKQGPMLDSYRGLSIIHSRQYSLETGAPPRDLLRRRVRVAEYYRIPYTESIGDGRNTMVDLYDESKDTFFTISWKELLRHAALDEADIAKFNDVGNQPQVLNLPFGLAAVHNYERDTGGVDEVVVARSPVGFTGANANPAAEQLDIRLRFTPQYANVADDVPGPGLILITNKKMFSIVDNDAEKSTASFYTGSGWFGCAWNADRMSYMYAITMIRFPDNLHQRSINVTDNATLPNAQQRRPIFIRLAIGNVDVAPATYLLMGMRPNLHIGRMAFANQVPEMVRFKHIAANIMAQTVVTRGAAVRLMAQAEKGDPVPDAIKDSILELFGLDEKIAIAADVANWQNGKRSYYNLETTVLAYMAAAVMHPNTTTKNHCINALLKNYKMRLDDFGDQLVTWIKAFLHRMPVSDQSPTFDALVQGRILEETIKAHVEDFEEGMGNPLKVPVMYLGEFIPLQPNGNIDFDNYQVPKWPNIEADVDSKTFTKTTSHVFPGKKRPPQQDMIAINKTATNQDALIAFITIMCKRFFTCEQHKYVEMQDYNMTRPNLLDGEIGLYTRLALTSNEYPIVFAGRKALLEEQQKWEIVLVRPNIEHNMLAAVIGKGGSEDLGSTFWGQTELSCYDDSMHGIWGMSYKYHERAVVTEEKNLIRLFDIAYDGYNGGKDDTFVSWTEGSGHRSYKTLQSETANTMMPYTGPSIMVMAFPVDQNDRTWERNWPSPIVFHDNDPGKPLMQEPNYVLDPDNVERVFDERMRVFGQLYNRHDAVDPAFKERYRRYYDKMPKFTYMHTTKKSAGQAVAENESTGISLAFQGTFRVWTRLNGGAGAPSTIMDVKGSGHHGVDYVGVASVRSGKGYKITGEHLHTVRQV